MPIFSINSNDVRIVKPTKFPKEKNLQGLVENNLDEFFNCRFVATEQSTGSNHAGRIDTLALSEENNPVIIEYKIVESSDLLNQSLFYLSWIDDHRGDFQVLVNEQLGNNIQVDWSDIRVICLAPGYKKYDLHAVTMMGANIELWKYRLFENSCIQLEEVFSRSHTQSKSTTSGKDPKMVEAGKKAAETRRTATYSVEEHLDGKSDKIIELVEHLREFALGLEDGIEENPKKNYIAYKTTQNFLCIDTRKSKVLLYLKLDPTEITPLPDNARDVSSIGHYGTGNFELSIQSLEDVEEAKYYIEESFKKHWWLDFLFAVTSITSCK